MEFQEFKDKVLDHIKDFLPENFENVEINIQQVHKNNQILEGLVIRDPNVNVSPTIYLNNFFEQAENGRDISDIMAEIARVYVDHAVDKDFDVSHITSFENVKDDIFPRVVGTEDNEELLSPRPHRVEAEDLAIIYAVNLGTNEDGSSMTVPVTNSLMESWNIDANELHDIAMKNMDEKMEIQFKSMSEVVSDMMVENMIQDGMTRAEAQEIVTEMMPPEDAMFVLSNSGKLNGAVAAFDEKTMAEIAEKLGTDFYVLPSSIHETLIIPMSEGSPNRESLEAMVREVNETQVAPEDRLSDSVYAYDREDKVLMRADKYEERQNEKKQERSELKSFKEQLDEAKEDQKAMLKQADKQPKTKENTKNKATGIGD